MLIQYAACNMGRRVPGTSPASIRFRREREISKAGMALMGPQPQRPKMASTSAKTGFDSCSGITSCGRSERGTAAGSASGVPQRLQKGALEGVPAPHFRQRTMFGMGIGSGSLSKFHLFQGLGPVLSEEAGQGAIGQ